jgi:hypothetical protein
VRGQLHGVRMLLAEARRDLAALGTPERVGLAERLREAHEHIERLPPMTAVRPFTIALHNLVVMLGHTPDDAAALAGEIDAALETLDELLADPMFGVEAEDLKDKVHAALEAKGVHACPSCRHLELTIEIAYVLMKPYPSDPALVPSQLPCATVVCKRCGMWWKHDLGVLGVM